MVPVSWIFALILNTPLFLVFNFDKKINSCMGMWPKKWMSQAFPLTWEIMVIVIMALMVMLYSKVVYTLWIKRNDGSQLTHQEIVSVNLEVIICFSSSNIHIFCHA